MRKVRLMALIPAAMIAAACGRNSSPAVDDALKNDLALASQAQPGNQPVISPNEAGLAAQPQAASLAPRTTHTATRAPVSSARRSSARRSSGVSSSSGGGYYPATPHTTVEKHTQRDAAIGAAAGAVLGATTSRNKVKGGIIGAAVGGILGGVLGNNVDVHRTVTP
jgi:hypothetical protein